MCLLILSVDWTHFSMSTRRASLTSWPLISANIPSFPCRYRINRLSIPTFGQHFGQASMDHTAHAFSNTGIFSSFNVMNNYNNTIIADEGPEIMRWLSPLDSGRRHRDVRNDRHDGVGNWLLETGQLREWRSNEGGADKAVLFCYGNPGVGKTYLRQASRSFGRNRNYC